MTQARIVKYVPFDGETSGILQIEFVGTHYKLLNALRRVSLKYVPTYAFHPDKILFTKNTSVAFNNDMLKLRFSNLPLFNVDPDLDYLEDIYWKNVKYSDSERSKHPKEQQIEGYINYKNTTDNIVNVTTHDMKLKINGKDQSIYTKAKPIVLVKLKKDEEICCQMTAVLGIGEINDIWSAAQNAYYEIDNDKILFSVETAGKINLFDILLRSCLIMIIKLENLGREIKQKIELCSNDRESEYLDLEFDEDYGLIDILNYELQQNGNIEFSGIARHNLLNKKVNIKISNSDKLLVNIASTIEILVKKIKTIHTTILKLRTSKE